MNTKILFFSSLILCTLSAPMDANAITAAASLSIFIGNPGNPNYEDRLTLDAQATFNAPNQINQNTQVSVEIMKSGQAGTPYTGQLNMDCTSGCSLGGYFFTSGSQVGVTYSYNTTLSVSNYGTHTLNMLINELPAFSGQVHHIGYTSSPVSFTVNAPPPSYQCSDNIDNDGDGPRDSDDPQCHTDCNASNPLTYISTHNSESVSPNGSCPVPSGSITAGNCSIPINGNICSSLIVWSSNNANNPVVELNNGPVYGGVSGSQSFPMNPNSSPLTFILRASGVGSQELDRDTAQAFCVPDSTWNGSSCVADPPTVYSCTGIAPNNAGLCSGDNTGLTANTPNTLVPACTVGTKCEHTCDVGYEFSGGVCVVSSSPSASINAPDCDILAGQSSCTSSVSWNTSGITSPSIRQNGTQFSTLSSSGGTSRVLLRGTYTFTVYDGATERASDIATAECISGTVWDGDSCEVVTGATGNISASPNPCTVIAGASTCTSNVSWNTSGATTPGVWTSIGGLFSSNPSGVNVPSPAVGPYTPVTLQLRNNNFSGTILDSVTITAECTLGSAWDGDSCEVVVGATGIISANPLQCDIAIGASTCTSDISWSTSGATTPGVWTSAGVLFSSLANSMGTYPSPAVGRSAPVTLNLRNNNSSGTILDSVTITAECTLGSAWDGDSCEVGTTTTASITAGNCTIPDGQSTCSSNVVWSTTGLSSVLVSKMIPGGSTSVVYFTTSGNENNDIPFGDTIFRVYDGDNPVSALALDTATASCDNDATWNGTICVANATPGEPKLIICPATDPISVAVGNTRQLEAWYWASYSGTPTCSNSGSTRVTDSATWSSKDDVVASVNNAGSKGLVTGLSVGNTEIQANYSGLTATKDVTVIAMIQDPDITITADPTIVRSGDTAEVEIDITGAVSSGTCTLAGAVTGIINYGAGNTSQTETTVPLTSSRIVQVTCGANEESVTINVIPTFQEI